MDIHDEIRQRIREKLEEHSLSVRGAALAASLGETTLRNFLDGMTQSLTVETVTKLAPVLKASVQWILVGETAEIQDLWDHVPIDQRPLARRVLEPFATRKSSGS